MNIYYMKEDQGGFQHEKAQPQHCDTSEGAVNFHPGQENDFSYSELKTRRWNVVSPLKIRATAGKVCRLVNLGSFYSVAETRMCCQSSAFLCMGWDILTIQLPNLGKRVGNKNERFPFCGPSNKVLQLAHTLCSNLGAGASCWIWISSFTSIHIFIVIVCRARGNQRKLQASFTSLQTALNSSSKRSVEKYLIVCRVVWMHKAGLCWTRTNNVINVRDASVSSPEGRRNPRRLNCTGHTS